MNKATRLALATAVCSVSLFAQRRADPGTTKIPFAGTDAESALQKIFSNLGTGTNVYTSDGSAFSLAGPNSAAGFTQYEAIPFTPKSNATVEAVSAAIQYIGGTNQINLSIYSDASGAPGTLLAGPFTVKNVPIYPTCCKLASASVKPSFSVTAGAQYWLVADTPSAGTGSDFEGAWVFIPPSKLLVSVNSGVGLSWFTGPADIQEPAGAIYGSIP